MAQETITDYEVKTEEKTRTITICDNCGASDEEKTIVPVGINPKVEESSYEDWDIIEVYDDKMDAEMHLSTEYPNNHNQLQNFEKKWGIGVRRNSQVKDAYVSAQSDLCVGCVSKFLDVDIPDDEEITDIEFEEGGISIETEKVIEKNYPTISLPELQNKGWGLLHVIVWPLIFLFSISDILAEEQVKGKWDEESKAAFTFYTGLGAILWSTIGFMFYLGAGILL